MIIALNKMLTSHVFPTQTKTCHIHLPPFRALQHTLLLYRLPGPVPLRSASSIPKDPSIVFCVALIARLQ